MPAITLTVTTAGRAALVDAANAGTNEVRIAAAGLTATAFVANAAAVALPGEFSRIGAIAGATVDPDTISLIIRDDSVNIYTLRGFGLFLDNGTLFALYGQPGAILEKSANSTALIAVDVRFADINAAHLTFGNANFLNPPATQTTPGVIEIATDVEAVTGTDGTRAVTPSGLKALIDARFGAGAATTFVKSLLTAASAAAFRLTLGLKSAAIKDEGPGNGLDADTVDGLHANTLVWPHLSRVDGSGVMEVGARIDFHNSSNDPSDYGAYLSLVGSNLTRNGAVLWDAGNDGAGSGLDADLLDGIQSTSFLRRDMGGPWELAAGGLDATFGGAGLTIRESQFLGDSGNSTSRSPRLAFHWSGRAAIQLSMNYFGVLELVDQFGTGYADFRARNILLGGGFYAWHAGNDGAGSGLDADLLDGQDSSFFTNIIARLGYTPYNLASVPSGFGSVQNGIGISSIDPDGYTIGSAYFSTHPNNGYGGALAYVVTLSGGDAPGRGFQFSSSNGSSDLLMRSRPAGWTRVWTAGNDGAGSGLDADQLDGRDAASFANASHSHGATDIAPAFDNKSLGTTGFQALPGGLLIQWGQYRGFFSGEGSVAIGFSTTFSGDVFSITATAINPSASNNRDSTIQIVSRDENGFTAYFQNNGGAGGNSDGFDWIAIGAY